MDKNKLIKIIVPIVIVSAIAAIWILKNTKAEPITIPENQAGFELEVTSIDMETWKSYKVPIIIDFGADSCAPCRAMAPVLKAINSEMQGKAIIKFIDVWKYGEAVGDFPVQVIPTQIIYDAEGKPYVPSEGLGIEFTTYTTRDTNEHIFTIHQGGLTKEQMELILSDMGVEQ